MSIAGRTLIGLVAAVALSLAVSDAHAQGFGDRLRKKAQERLDRAKDEAAERTVDKAENTVRCAVGDKACADKARAEGKTVELTGTGAAGGAAAGATAGAAASGGAAAAGRLGDGAWANYDFIPGVKPLYVDDFTRDVVGDFPKRMEFKTGALEIVEWNGARHLRSAAWSEWFIRLPEVMPARFTVEFDYAMAATHELWLSFGDDNNNRVWFRGDGTAGVYNSGAGIQANGRYTSEGNVGNVVRRARIMVDGKYAKVYVNEKRIVNVPNAALQRSAKIALTAGSSEAEPSLFSNFTIMAGGRRLYDDLAASGRVATQGILFATGSDVIRPESSPTLKEIAAMLTEHPELSLVIEGHTDNVGGAAANLALSQKRADAVKAALVATYGADGSRLTSRGLGDTKPAGANTTAEGRQQNRRVELVRG